MRGFQSIFIRGFGVVSVSGLSLDPSPDARMIAFINIWGNKKLSLIVKRKSYEARKVF